jgi:hypothetical protein
MNRIATNAPRAARFAPLAVALLAIVLVVGCNARTETSAGAVGNDRSAVSVGQKLGIDIGPRDTSPAPAAFGSGKHQGEKDLEAMAASGDAPRSLPGPDDWRIITASLQLFRHAPYVADLVLGLLASVAAALVLTATPRRAMRFDPVAQAESRKATVIVALIGCVAAELVQASEHFLLGAEIALVLFGIGGLVRFRTVFGDARQTGMAIVATVLGLACGMSEYSLVALSLVIIFLVNWWLSNRAFVRIRAKVRKHGDLAQVQTAIGAVLQHEGFAVVRSSSSASKRTIDIHAQTNKDFDVESLGETIEAAVPSARIRVSAS